MDNFKRFTSDWHYASATSFFVAGDQRNLFVPGTRIKYSQIDEFGAVIDEFGVVTTATYADSRTTVTFDAESQYALANANILNPCYSHEYIVTSDDPTFIPDIPTAHIDDGAITTAKLASTLDLTGKDVKIAVKEGTPVNAVAATGTLTLTGNAVDNETVVVGNKTYTFQSAIGVAAAATGILTLTGDAQDTEEVVIGSKTYTFKTALTEAKAAGVLTATGNFADAETVTIGSVTYKFSVNLSDPAVTNEIKIGADASASLDNLIAAINAAAGAGTTYSTGTVVHPTVSAAAGAGDTVDLTAKTIGVAGNAIATTTTAGDASFGAVTLENGADAVVNEVVVAGSASASIDNLIVAITHGAGEGTAYSTGTTASTQVTAAAGAGDTMDVTASSTGDASNSIVTTTTMANASWGAGTLEGGEGAEAANDVLIGINASATIDNLIAAINKAAGEGTTYGTGTVAHTQVTAAVGAGDTMGLTAKTKGEAANAIATTTDMSNASWGAETLEGGIDGTVGVKYEIYADASYLYVAKAANTVADQNWRRIDLGSAY